MWQALQDFPYFGETSALASALLWGIAVILFRISGRNVRPLSLNLFKCTLCILLFIPTILILGDPLVPALSTASLCSSAFERNYRDRHFRHPLFCQLEPGRSQSHSHPPMQLQSFGHHPGYHLFRRTHEPAPTLWCRADHLCGCHGLPR